MQPVLDKSDARIGSGSDRLFDAGGSHSLDDVVSRLTQTLTVRGNAVCPVCCATLVRSGDEQAAGAAGCTGCGSSFE
jgi:hypothetical protein